MLSVCPKAESPERSRTTDHQGKDHWVACKEKAETFSVDLTVLLEVSPDNDITSNRYDSYRSFHFDRAILSTHNFISLISLCYAQSFSFLRNILYRYPILVPNFCIFFPHIFPFFMLDIV